MAKILLAMTLGVGSGLPLAVFLQKQLNVIERSRCQQMPEKLVQLHTVIGDAFYCLPNYANGLNTGP
jgi:hypothetical protein